MRHSRHAEICARLFQREIQKGLTAAGRDVVIYTRPDCDLWAGMTGCRLAVRTESEDLGF